MSLLKKFFSLLDIAIITEEPRRHYNNKTTHRSVLNTIAEEIFNTQCTLRPGSIVVCDLALGFEHSGIYIGRNRIVERNGNGKIIKISIKDFLNSSTLRTGVTLYAACENGKIITSPEIAKRARSALNNDPGYHLIHNNCHKLTAYLATGKHHDISTFSSLANILSKDHPELEWKSAKL